MSRPTTPTYAYEDVQEDRVYDYEIYEVETWWDTINGQKTWYFNLIASKSRAGRYIEDIDFDENIEKTPYTTELEASLAGHMKLQALINQQLIDKLAAQSRRISHLYNTVHDILQLANPDIFPLEKPQL